MTAGDIFKSRKLFVLVLGLVLIAAVLLLTGKLTFISPNYGTFVGGVISLCGLYMTGNAAQHFVENKYPPTDPPTHGPGPK